MIVTSCFRFIVTVRTIRVLLMLAAAVSVAAQPPGGSASVTNSCCLYQNISASDLVETMLVTGDCIDTHEKCPLWAEEGECELNDGYMLEACPCSCHSCPTLVENHWDDEPQIAFGPLKEEIEYVIRKTEAYMKESVLDQTGECRNKHRGCSHWSLLGECELNPRFMLEDCGPACQSCHRNTKRKRR